MPGLLQDQVAVIYGGGGAIGGAVARVFAREGAWLFLACRRIDRLQRVAADIRAAGGRAEYASVDAFDEAAVHAHLDAVAGAAGRIDVLFNAIGIAHVQGKGFLDTPLAEFADPITRTVRAQFIAAQAAARHMVKRKRGVILTLSTPGGRLVGRGFLANGVFSAATEAFSRLIAAELGREGIRSVVLRPDAIPEAALPTPGGSSHANEVFENVARQHGVTVQDMLAERARTATLLGRLPRLAEVAEFAAFVASDRAGAMTGAVANLTCGSLVD